MSPSVISRGNQLVVLGGGMSGLSAAYYLTKLPSSIRQGRKIVLIESSNYLGGWVKTTRHDDGVLHELGPRAVQSIGLSAPNTLQLVSELGLSSRIIGNSPSAKLRYIMKDGKLIPLPHSLLTALKKSPVFSQKSPILYLLQEAVKKGSLDASQDFSMYDMINDRFGRELAENIADPFCRGITAGDARKTSVKALFPQMHKAVKSGSLVKGMMAPVLPSEFPFNTLFDNELLNHVRRQKWRSWSLDTGLGTLGEKLACVLRESEDVQVLTNTRVESLNPSPDGRNVTVTVGTQDGQSTLDAEHVFSSLPSGVLKKVLPGQEDDSSLGRMKKILDTIKAVNVAVACIEYPRKLTSTNGFGFLVPSSESCPLLGVTFDSSVFPVHDGGKNITRVTTMLGGAWFNSLFSGKSASQIADIALEETSRILKCNDKPIRMTCHIHESCIPQYTLNHKDRVTELKEISSKMNISLLGSSYEGVSVNDVILSGRRAVHNWSESQEN